MALTGGVAAPKMPSRNKKRQKAKDILSSFKSRLNKQKAGFGSLNVKTEVGGAKRGPKKKMIGDEEPPKKKRRDDEDSALEYSDGNDEYDNA